MCNGTTFTFFCSQNVKSFPFTSPTLKNKESTPGTPKVLLDIIIYCFTFSDLNVHRNSIGSHHDSVFMCLIDIKHAQALDVF